MAPWLDRLLQNTAVLLEHEQAIALQQNRRREALAGLERQLQQLQAMAAESLALRHGESATSGPWQQWHQLRDHFSLHPSNGAFTEAFHDLALALWGGDGSALAKLKHKPLILHLSCQARLKLALRSVDSFAACQQAGLHVVVVGGASQLGFRPLADNSWLLQLPESDAYEKLHAKLFLGVALLWLWLRPTRIAKLDDDLHLKDGEMLMDYLQGLEADRIKYGGRMIQAKHSQVLHGWHLGKCSAAGAALNNIGYQFPIAKCFAAGGSGYVLADTAIDEIAYAHLAMRGFLDGCEPGIEDGLVGLLMRLAELESRDCRAPILPGLACHPILMP